MVGFLCRTMFYLKEMEITITHSYFCSVLIFIKEWTGGLFPSYETYVKYHSYFG